MEFVYQLLVILHFIGLASLLGGFLVQTKAIAKGKGVIHAAMVHGALTQLVTGVALVGIAEAVMDADVNHMKIGIKLGVVLVITVLVFVFRKKTAVPSWVLWAIGALTLANIVVAVLL